MLNEQDKIKELFSEKLGSFEAPVNPALWKGVASQIGSASVVTATGITLITKVIIGAVACSAIGVASYFVFKENSIANTTKNDLKLSEQTSTLGSKPSNEKNELESGEKVMKAHGFDEKADYLAPESADQVNGDTEVRIDEPFVSVLKNPTVQQSTKLPVTPGETSPTKGNQTIPPAEAPKKIILPPTVPPSPVSVVYSASLDKVANVFTPNGDRVNDEWFIEYTGELNDFNLVILDRNNKTIYTSQDPNFKWNGAMMNGETAPAGSYVYLITARDSKGNKLNKADRLSISLE